MVTARNQREDIVRALNLGANDYLTKPIDFPVALARIGTQLSRKRDEVDQPATESRLRDRGYRPRYPFAADADIVDLKIWYSPFRRDFGRFTWMDALSVRVGGWRLERVSALR